MAKDRVTKQSTTTINLVRCAISVWLSNFPVPLSLPLKVSEPLIKSSQLLFTHEDCCIPFLALDAADLS